MALLSLYFFVIFFFQNGAVFCVFDEPICSKFHFEEKVLEKLINLEINVNQELKKMAEKNDKLETLVTTENAELTTKLTRISDELQLTKTELRENKEAMNTLESFEKDFGIVQTNLSVLEEKISRDRKDLDPVFFVVHGTSGSLSHNKPIVYQTVLSNQGNGYNSATGVFTAPRNGVYIFSAQICSSNHVNYQIQINDVPHSSSYQYSGTPGVCSSVSTTALLKSSDQVAVRILNSGVQVKSTGNSRAVWNMFSGTLVS